MLGRMLSVVPFVSLFYFGPSVNCRTGPQERAELGTAEVAV